MQDSICERVKREGEMVKRSGLYCLKALADYFPVLKWVSTNVLISGNFVLFALLGGE